MEIMETPKRKSIKDWAVDERPREKMLTKGPEALSNAELLAILIGSGTVQKSALELARELLELAGNRLKELSRFNVHEIKKIRGLGPARAVAIEAALELSRRRDSEPDEDEEIILTSRDAERALLPMLRDKPHEEFYMLCLNRRNKVVAKIRISEGGMASTQVDIRRIMKSALDTKALSIVLGHNHPSGNLNPSESDKALTLRIGEATKIFDILLMDHLILTSDSYYSFADNGLLNSRV